MHFMITYENRRSWWWYIVCVWVKWSTDKGMLYVNWCVHYCIVLLFIGRIGLCMHTCWFRRLYLWLTSPVQFSLTSLLMQSSRHKHALSPLYHSPYEHIASLEAVFINYFRIPRIVQSALHQCSHHTPLWIQLIGLSYRQYSSKQYIGLCNSHHLDMFTHLQHLAVFSQIALAFRSIYRAVFAHAPNTFPFNVLQISLDDLTHFTCIHLVSLAPVYLHLYLALQIITPW